jgi:23S rRNA (cytidine1920-2'-O)/16S rRNA (cytidine1409-2'-O)-methyltransferase
MPIKERLDTLLVQRGLVSDKTQAQRLVMAGQVRVAGQIIDQPSTTIPTDSSIVVVERPRYVSRGGEKLEAALKAFALNAAGRICADVGASTGGFTDCLLQHGAEKVYAIDAGRGILDWKLRQDPRVVVLEKTNVRQLEKLPQPVDLVTVDVSFISIKAVLPVVSSWFVDALTCAEPQNQADIIALVKPQFEATRIQADRGRGVIRDPDIHRQVLMETLHFAEGLNGTPGG